MSLAASAHASARPVVKASGTVAAKAAIATTGKAKRKRRPAVRALKAVAVLQAASCGEEILAESSLAAGTEVVQRSAMSDSAATADDPTAINVIAIAIRSFMFWFLPCLGTFPWASLPCFKGMCRVCCSRGSRDEL